MIHVKLQILLFSNQCSPNKFTIKPTSTTGKKKLSIVYNFQYADVEKNYEKGGRGTFMSPECAMSGSNYKHRV